MAVAAVDYFVGSSQQNDPAARRGCAAASSSARRVAARHGRATGSSSSRCARRSRWRCRRSCRARASAAGCAPRSTTRAWPPASASTSTACSCSPSRSARAWPAWAARWAPRSSGSTRRFPLKFMIYFLIVVRGRRHQLDHRPAAGGAAARHRRRGGQVLRAQARRLHRLRADDRDPAVAAAGPVRAQGRTMSDRRRSPAARCCAPCALARRGRSWLWLAFAAVAVRAAGRHALLINEIAILALFALSLDLILGYAGIVSLGHAAFFGFGAYGAALFAKHVMPDPLVGLAVGTVAGRAARRADQPDDPARHRPHAADGDAGHRAACCSSSPTSSTDSPAAPTACRAW